MTTYFCIHSFSYVYEQISLHTFYNTSVLLYIALIQPSFLFGIFLVVVIHT
jgi:hypothetical protein